MYEYYLQKLVSPPYDVEPFTDPACTWAERNILASLAKHYRDSIPITYCQTQYGVAVIKDLTGLTTSLLTIADDKRISGAILSRSETPLRIFHPNSKYPRDELYVLNKVLMQIGLPEFENKDGQTLDLLLSLFKILNIDYDSQLIENTNNFAKWIKKN